MKTLNRLKPIMLQDGYQSSTVNAELLTLRTRAWEHDYFTSCLPFAPKRDAVEIPLDIQGMRIATNPFDGTNWTNKPQIRQASTDNTITNDVLIQANTEAHSMAAGTLADHGMGYWDPGDSLKIDTSNAGTATTLNDLRNAFSLQRWLEKNARAGSRYVETLLAHFGVRSSDKRLQRPEYLGGYKATMVISEVLQTSATATGSATPQANMAGHGISVSGSTSHFSFCEEHGYIITLVSIRPKTSYYQGLPRHFSKFDRLQFFWPEFAHLGEQPVLNQELFYDNTDGLNEETFGDLPRYAEYRYNPSRICGQMTTSLDFWHMGRKFASRPALNNTFIKAVTDKRVFAVTDPTQDEVVAHIFHSITAKRPIPRYGTPGSI